MKTLKYIISLILLHGWSVVLSQGLTGESPKKDYVPSEIIFAADIIGLGTSLFTDETNFEFHYKINFHHFYLAADFGFYEINPSSENFNYKSKGSFFRIGPHVNLIPYNKHRSSIFFGLMYAKSNFSDEIQYQETDSGWGTANDYYTNDNLRASWYEANIGLNVRIAGPLYLGYTVRFKFAKSLFGNDVLFPFEIPGFGDAAKGSNFAFNYYVVYKLRFRDKPIGKKPIKVRIEE